MLNRGDHVCRGMVTNAAIHLSAPRSVKQNDRFPSCDCPGNYVIKFHWASVSLARCIAATPERTDLSCQMNLDDRVVEAN